MKIENPQINFEIVNQLLHLPRRYPSRAQIEITNRCNLDCGMCPRSSYKLPYEDMPFALFKELVDKLKDVEQILPVGWGECFMHPDIDKIVDYLKDNNHEIKVTTNGLLLDSERLMKTALKMDSLSFSLDALEPDNAAAGHNNSQVIENVKRILARRLPGKPYVTLQSVLFRKNDDIFKIIKLASEIKIDRINLVRPYSKFNKNLALPWSERKEIYKKAEKLGRELAIRVDMWEYASFTGIKRLLWKHFKWAFKVNSHCPRLHDFVYVTLNGEVAPCCALPRHVVGDLKKQSLSEIWHGKRMKTFRKNHIRICKDCEVLKIR